MDWSTLTLVKPWQEETTTTVASQVRMTLDASEVGRRRDTPSTVDGGQPVQAGEGCAVLVPRLIPRVKPWQEETTTTVASQVRMTLDASAAFPYLHQVPGDTPSTVDGGQPVQAGEGCAVLVPRLIPRPAGNRLGRR
jgi:hypothetical protein